MSIKSNCETIRQLNAFSELCILTAMYLFTLRSHYTEYSFSPYTGKEKLIVFILYFFVVLILFKAFDTLQFGVHKFLDVCISQIFCITVANVVAYFHVGLVSDALVPVKYFVLLTVIQFVVIFVLVLCYSHVYHFISMPPKVLLLSGISDTSQFVKKMTTRPDAFKIDRICSVKDSDNTIFDVIDAYDAVMLYEIPYENRRIFLKYCFEHKKRTYVIPRLSDVIIRGATEITLFDTPMVLVKNQGLSLSERFIKRCFDLFFSIIAAIACFPLFLIIATAIKLEDKGPVFYKQDRITRNHKHFNILKFRSMVIDAEKNGVQAAVDNDPRITKTGKIIRTLRLDELPQILNIIRGDMSIVGPRPERYEHVDKYTEEIPEFKFRELVKGGLTGMAQVYGKYNTSAYDKLRMDLTYIENYSLFLDIKLIVLTVATMFKKESTQGFDKQ